MADRNPVTGRFLTRPANSGRKKGVKAVKRWFVRPRRRRPPRCGCACHETSACHDRATIRRRLEEAAGVETQFEAIQSTETPLEFLLRKMRDTSRVHLCRPRQAVTKLPVTKSGGRPPQSVKRQ